MNLLQISNYNWSQAKETTEAVAPEAEKEAENKTKGEGQHQM